ncbi:MAG: tryptophan-rich sensory protein [Oscillibacter sp.]|nr:tryptophan-rich sensory protein [Oscillibacter sp.]
MKNQTWKVYLAWILFTEAVGGLSGWLTREGTKYFNAAVTKPPFSPPGIVFPIVWAALYLLMGVGAARVYLTPGSRARSRSLFLYLLQLTFNFCWSVIFFTVRAYGAAFLWLVVLWFLILSMILSFREVDSLAGNLQIPYLIWVLFAGYLNAGVWALNR